MNKRLPSIFKSIKYIINSQNHNKMASIESEQCIEKEAEGNDKNQEENKTDDPSKKSKKPVQKSGKKDTNEKKKTENQGTHEKQSKLTNFWTNNTNSISNSLTKLNGNHSSNKESLKKKMEDEQHINTKLIEKILKEKQVLKAKYLDLQTQSAAYRQRTQQVLEKTMREVAKYKRESKEEVDANLGWYAFNTFDNDKLNKSSERRFIPGKFLTQITSKKKQVEKKIEQIQQKKNGCTKKLPLSQHNNYELRFLKNELAYIEKELQRRNGIVQEYKMRLHIGEREKFCKYATLGWPVINDQYLTTELLGSGGFGEVYKCFDLKSNQYVALKINQVPATSRFEGQIDLILKHIRREVEIQKKLNHPNIIKILGVLQISHKQVSFFIEYCQGPQLSRYLKKNKCLQQIQAKQIIRQILCALKYLYEQPSKIIHYDLKPSNVMFHNGIIKILDFGLCKEIGTDQTKIDLTSQGVGTYWYLPPETFLPDYGEGIKISSKVDIWSVGVIFFELLYGVKPFGNEIKQSSKRLPQLISQAKKVKFPVESPLHYKISDEAKKFISQCLQYNQQQRLDPLQAWGHAYFKK